MDRFIPSWASHHGRSYTIRVTESNGQSSEVRWSSDTDCFFIGRHVSCHLNLRQKEASRYHACLARNRTGELYIVDLNSRAGTYVNGTRVRGRRSERRIKIYPRDSIISFGTNDEMTLTLFDENKTSPKSFTKLKITHSTDTKNEVCYKRKMQNSADDDAEDGVSGIDVDEKLVSRSGMTREEKRQLLWGNKKAQAEDSAIRWDTAEFQTTEQRSKFQRLMGMKTSAPDGEQSAKTAEDKREVLKGEAQDEVLQSVEKHFVAGLRRADGRTVGLGL